MSVHIPQQWSEATECIANNSDSSDPPIAFICGPNSCGKTTFSLHLVNFLLQSHNKVAYLDTDAGQTVFTPPGFLSLTVIDRSIPDLKSPSLKTPERCFFYGDISPKNDPEMYLSCIFNLFDHYLKEHRMKNDTNCRDAGLPLVINTHGWVKGVGYEVLEDMIKYMSPTHVVKIQISSKAKNLPAGAFWMSEGIMDTSHLIEMKAVAEDLLYRSVHVQKDHRVSRLMEYFRQCFLSDKNLSRTELCRAIIAHPPYEVPISIFEVKHLYCEVAATEIYRSLNATIVGLAISSKVSFRLSRCVGLGLVRSVDPEKGMLYIVTPVPQRYLVDVDLLLQGLIQIPQCLLEASGHVSPYMSPDVIS
ncbi:polynucleotide 5'-hydroxyl-kinase NOL9-like isoform X2 [Henckelia pumila]|uniref:polynucleotide 5'-hydroxyl-kinase NOL9-like isoform X2 n=1 Tax=Henckelia pumila TaxID=405737 RepID=UPI003C6DF59C